MNETSDNWYVKTADDRLYGPVTLEKLVTWAENGQIQPTYSVSNDNRATWRRATQIKELRMEWIVELADGRLFGPFNRAVIDQLEHDKRLSPEDRTFCLCAKLPPPVTALVALEMSQPAVKEPESGVVHPATTKGVFAGASHKQLSVLENAVRKELLNARQKGISINLFGGGK